MLTGYIFYFKILKISLIYMAIIVYYLTDINDKLCIFSTKTVFYLLTSVWEYLYILW